MDTEIFVKQLDSVLLEFKQIATQSQRNDLSDLALERKTTLITKAKAASIRISGINSVYSKEIERLLNKDGVKIGPRLRQIIGCLEALRDDLKNDYLKSISELIHSEVFADYLEMASYLLEGGYKNASAVIVGSTLEAHLRRLCEKNSIDLTFTNENGKEVAKKADLINSDLNKAEVYNKTYQKQITAWLDLRNNAAHGNYEDFSLEEVKLMVLGINNFMIQYPA